MLRTILTIVLAAMIWALQAQSQNPLFSAAPGSPVVAGESPGQVLVVDVNGDGRLDLVTRHLLEKFIAVQIGDGAGRFISAPGSPIALKFQPGDVKTADINGDNIPDLVVTESEMDRVDLFFGDGKGGFRSAPGSPLTVSADDAFYTHNLHLVDLNEDGKLDIVTVNHRRNTFAGLLGNGRGAFSPGPTITIPVNEGNFRFAAGDMFGDLDGDNHLDLVIVNGDPDSSDNPGRARIFRGDGKGTFKQSPATALSVPAIPHFVRLADFNGDQRLDIVTSHNIDQLSVLLNEGNGRFTPALGSPHKLDATAFAVSVADVNGDHRNDLVAATVESVTVLLGGKEGMTVAPGSPFRAGPGAFSLTLGDVNKDGKLDIAASSFGGNAVTILLGQ